MKKRKILSVIVSVAMLFGIAAALPSLVTATTPCTCDDVVVSELGDFDSEGGWAVAQGVWESGTGKAIQLADLAVATHIKLELSAAALVSAQGDGIAGMTLAIQGGGISGGFGDNAADLNGGWSNHDLSGFESWVKTSKVGDVVTLTIAIDDIGDGSSFNPSGGWAQIQFQFNPKTVLTAAYLITEVDCGGVVCGAPVGGGTDCIELVSTPITKTTALTQNSAVHTFDLSALGATGMADYVGFEWELEGTTTTQTINWGDAWGLGGWIFATSGDWGSTQVGANHGGNQLRATSLAFTNGNAAIKGADFSAGVLVLQLSGGNAGNYGVSGGNTGDKGDVNSITIKSAKLKADGCVGDCATCDDGNTGGGADCVILDMSTVVPGGNAGTPADTAVNNSGVVTYTTGQYDWNNAFFKFPVTLPGSSELSDYASLSVTIKAVSGDVNYKSIRLYGLLNNNNAVPDDTADSPLLKSISTETFAAPNQKTFTFDLNGAKVSDVTGQSIRLAIGLQANAYSIDVSDIKLNANGCTGDCATCDPGVCPGCSDHDCADCDNCVGHDCTEPGCPDACIGHDCDESGCLDACSGHACGGNGCQYEYCDDPDPEHCNDCTGGICDGHACSVAGCPNEICDLAPGPCVICDHVHDDVTCSAHLCAVKGPSTCSNLPHKCTTVPCNRITDCGAHNCTPCGITCTKHACGTAGCPNEDCDDADPDHCDDCTGGNCDGHACGVAGCDNEECGFSHCVICCEDPTCVICNPGCQCADCECAEVTAASVFTGKTTVTLGNFPSAGSVGCLHMPTVKADLTKIIGKTYSEIMALKLQESLDAGIFFGVCPETIPCSEADIITQIKSRGASTDFGHFNEAGKTINDFGANAKAAMSLTNLNELGADTVNWSGGDCGCGGEGGNDCGTCDGAGEVQDGYKCEDCGELYDTDIGTCDEETEESILSFPDVSDKDENRKIVTVASIVNDWPAAVTGDIAKVIVTVAYSNTNYGYANGQVALGGGGWSSASINPDTLTVTLNLMNVNTNIHDVSLLEFNMEEYGNGTYNIVKVEFKSATDEVLYTLNNGDTIPAGICGGALVPNMIPCTDCGSPIVGTVATPTANVVAGTYTSAQSVTLSSATTGATIRYTTDDSNPTKTHGTVFTAAINISATTTLKAIAYKDGMTDSAIFSATYTINTGGTDTTPPPASTTCTHGNDAATCPTCNPGTNLPQNDGGDTSAPSEDDGGTTTRPPRPSAEEKIKDALDALDSGDSGVLADTIENASRTEVAEILEALLDAILDGGDIGTLADALELIQQSSDFEVIGELILIADILEAILSEELVVLDDSTGYVISEIALQLIRAGGVSVEFELPNGLVLTIDPATITDDAKMTDLYIGIEVLERAATIETTRVPANSIVITPNASGEFGFAVSFDISAATLREAGLNGNNVKLWYVDYNGNVTQKGRVNPNSDGSVTVTISSASFYYLSEEEPDTSPRTGVTLGFAAALIAGATAAAARRKRK